MRCTKSQATLLFYGRHTCSLTLVRSCARALLSRAGPSLVIRQHFISFVVLISQYNYILCGDLGWVCVPLVTETYGAWGPEAMACFSQLTSRLSIRLQKLKSVILHELHGRLNTCLVRCVATAILSRIQSS